MIKIDEILLASGSPRRRELFEEAGLAFRQVPSSYEEKMPMELTAAELVQYYAFQKARHAEAPEGDVLVVGADTVVWKDRIMGKPVDEEEALSMMRSLSGTTHLVLTGVCLHLPATGITRCFKEVSEVSFAPLSEAFLTAYVKTKEPYDKAGAYAIQGTLGQYLTGLTGDRTNVIGFPMERFKEECGKLDLLLPVK